MEKENNMNKTIEEYEKKQRRDRRDKIILIIIIILLLMLGLVGCRVGKIGYQEVPSIIADDIKAIKVTGDDIEITKNAQLNIFENEKFNGEKIIAPKSKGEYKFVIENVAEQDISYDIKFLDEMQNPINMKYRLKIDNVYIKGSQNEYIGIEELNVENIVVLKDSINIFTLEWYWEDDDLNDTFVGSQKTDQYYKLNLEIGAKKYNEQR